MKVTETKLRVRYSETDQMGVAHHASYVAWLEVARVEYLTEIGFRYRDLESGGFLLAVIDLTLKYRRPAFFDDALRIETWVASFKPVKIEFHYRVLNEAGTLIAEGRTVLGCVNRQGRANPLPAEVADAIRQAMQDSTEEN